jgi:hypothetical protein
MVTTNKSGEMILAASQPKGKPKFKSRFKGECLCGLRATKLLIVGTMTRTKQTALWIIRKGHHINLIPSRILKKEKLMCDYCHKEGRTIESCYRKKKDDRKESKDHRMVCIAIDGENDFLLCKEISKLHRSGKDKHDTSLHEKYNMTCDTLY